MSGVVSIARTCQLTEGCSAAKVASRGASHSEVIDPLAEIASSLRVGLACPRTASHAASGLEVVGYEIHHGRTAIDAAVPMLTRPDGQVVGAASHDGAVWGTYLHGVFDSDAFRRWFIDRLRVRRGMSPVGGVTARYDIESALDRLADAVRQSISMDKIYSLMRLP